MNTTNHSKSTWVNAGLGATGVAVAIVSFVAVRGGDDNYASHDVNHDSGDLVAHKATPGVLTSDLDSPPIAPETSFVSATNLPPGSKLTPGSVTLTGAAFGQFQIETIRQEGMRLIVIAINKSQRTQRFAAIFAYEPDLDRPASAPVQLLSDPAKPSAASATAKTAKPGNR